MQPLPSQGKRRGCYDRRMLAGRPSFVSWTFLLGLLAVVAPPPAQEGRADPVATRDGRSESTRETIENDVLGVGIDRACGGAITWLRFADLRHSAVNRSDPGRLIQQSYYAGRSLDRRSEGQHSAWSPWPWNPIQGGGVGSWAKVTHFERKPGELHATTIPKLWDMPDEAAAATMLQRTSLDRERPNVVVVENELRCEREAGDAWGPAVPRPQELPACYFTRCFGDFASYRGDGVWREETAPLGPPWSRAEPPKKAMAVFRDDGQGIAVFSPAGNEAWNFGPVGPPGTDDPKASACVHLAPLATVALGPRSRIRYRYWLVVGDRSAIAASLDALLEAHGDERLLCDEVPR